MDGILYLDGVMNDFVSERNKILEIDSDKPTNFDYIGMGLFLNSWPRSDPHFWDMADKYDSISFANQHADEDNSSAEDWQRLRSDIYQQLTILRKKYESTTTTTATDTTTIAAATTGTTEDPPKRKRGRPRGSKNSKNSIAKTIETVDLTMSPDY
jgi:hypothetical protein